MPLEPVPDLTARQEAARVLSQLKDALKSHGITLPSVDLDSVSLTGAHMRPLIELGRVNLETARQLIRVLDGMDPQ